MTNSQAQQPVEKRESIWKDVLDGIVSNKAALVSAIFILLLALIAIVTKLVPGILPYDPYEQNLAESVQGPSAAHWFGTDIQGRDIFSRVLVGTQITLVVGLAPLWLYRLPLAFCLARLRATRAASGIPSSCASWI